MVSPEVAHNRWDHSREGTHANSGCGQSTTGEPTFPRCVRLAWSLQTTTEHGGGTYFWTVVVVREELYERVGALGEKRPFVYVVPEAPAEATAESP